MQHATTYLFSRTWRLTLQLPRSRWEADSCAERKCEEKGLVKMNTHTITINSPFIHSLQHNIQPDNKTIIHAMPRPMLRGLAIRVFRLRTLSESDRRAQPISSRRSTGESSSRALYHTRAGHVGRTQGYSPMSRREKR